MLTPAPSSKYLRLVHIGGRYLSMLALTFGLPPLLPVHNLRKAFELFDVHRAHCFRAIGVSAIPGYTNGTVGRAFLGVQPLIDQMCRMCCTASTSLDKLGLPRPFYES